GRLRAKQFPAGLIPVRIREFIQVAFGDERDFARPFFDRVRGGSAEAVAMNRNFACRMRVVVHNSKYERERGRVRMNYFIIQPAGGKGNVSFALVGTPRCGVRRSSRYFASSFADGAARRPYHRK